LSFSEKTYSGFINKHHLDFLNQDEEKKLIEKYQKTGDQKALDSLVLSNMRYVWKIAKPYLNYECDNNDLIQEGILGLIRSIKTFDTNKNLPLKAYAKWWILIYIQTAVSKVDHLRLRIPLTKLEVFRQIIRVFDTPEKRQNKDFYKMLKKRSMSLDTFNIILKNSIHKGINIDDISNNNKNTTMNPYNLDAFTYSLDDKVSASCLQKDILDQIKKLNKKEQTALLMRFGFLDGEEHTYESIGKHLGITREAARQKINKSLNKLKKTKLASWVQ